MDKFKELLSLCKCSVEVAVNDHKDYYESVSEHLTEDDKEGLSEEVLNEMIRRDTVIRVIAYPNTPVGNYCVYHYDLDMAIDIIINAIKNQ